MVTDPQTNTRTHKQTGPITIHCAAKLSAQCNELREKNELKHVLVHFRTKMIAIHLLKLELELNNAKKN